MKRFVLLLFLASQLIGVLSSCPANAFCKSTIDRHSCPYGYYYRENVKSRHCCPGCVQLPSASDTCIVNEDCLPGFACPRVGGICTDDPNQSCEYYKNNDRDWVRDQYWKPDCLSNGEYASKQCKGVKLSGKCFCTNSKGKRIFGEAEWLVADNMTCACSQLVHTLRQSDRISSLHCNDQGNFEELQCEDDVCWCSNERTGIPYTPVVPESMIRGLPCFDERHFGSRYLRQCDSILVHTGRINKLLKDHGTENFFFPAVNCNYDGSYARVQNKGLQKYCVYKNKTSISYPLSGPTDCNCAYDKFVAVTLNKKEFHLECEDNGVYRTPQVLGNKKFKVDPDGFPFDFQDLTTSVNMAESKNQRR